MSIVIFDSQVKPSGAEAVCMSATAEELAGEQLEAGIELFSRKSMADGLREWSREDVTEPARHRLYRAVVRELSALSGGDEGSQSTSPDGTEPVPSP